MDPDIDPDGLLDRAYLQRFKSKPARCRGLIQAFLDSTESILHQLQQALQQHHEEEFRQVLHALYGAAETVGATIMKAVCHQLNHSQNLVQQQRGMDDLTIGFQKLSKNSSNYLIRK